MAPMRSDSWRVEKQFVPTSLEETVRLRRALIEIAGQAPAEAAGNVVWILEKAYEGKDRATATTKARYRKALAKLVGLYPGPSESPLRSVPAAALDLVA
jgi:hypothetical protein